MLKLNLAILVTALSASLADAADARWTFDGSIHNNSLAISPDEETAVASYSERADVVVYDLKSGAVRGLLHDFVTPRNVVFDPTGRYFYVSDSSLGSVRQIETSSLRSVAALPAGPGAFGTEISRDGKTLYVNNEAANTVTSFDLEARRPKTVVVGFSQPRQGVRLSPDGATLFVTNFLGDKITLVDTATSRITGEISGFDKIRAISITHDGKTLFAANSGTDTIAVVDIGHRHITSTIPVGKDPYGAALTPDDKFVYSGNLADNSMTVIALASLDVVGTISGFKEPRQAIVFTHDGKHAYVLNEDLSISVVALAAGRIVRTITLSN